MRATNLLCTDILERGTGGFMKTTGTLAFVIALFAAASALCQAPAGPTSGPGVQAPNDSREPEVLKTCKTPPPGRGGRGGGRGPAAPAAPGPRDYKVAAIPGVIAAGQQWKEVWQV